MATIESNSSDDIGAARAAAPAYPGAYSRLRGVHFAGLLSILAGLALWEFFSRVVVANALFLAAPTQIFSAIYRLAVSGQLALHIAISAAEFAIGYVIASLLGIVTGFVMASSELGKKVLQPWIAGLYATPTIALAPLFILWLGIGIWSKVLVPRHSDFDMLNPSITATLARVLGPRGLRYCERRPVAV